MLETAGLQCIRGDRMLFTDISFRLEEGEILHIKGENGSGKTSLLRMLCGLMMPAAGKILWKGANIRKQNEEFNRDLLYLGHRLGIKSELTAVENLKLNSALSGHMVAEEDVWAALDRIGLRGREDLPTKVLSQGQQRRVALARLLVSRARLWVLDEPFVALDVKACAMLQGILAEHVENKGMIVYTTHQEFKIGGGRQRDITLGLKGVNA